MEYLEAGKILAIPKFLFSFVGESQYHPVTIKLIMLRLFNCNVILFIFILIIRHYFEVGGEVYVKILRGVITIGHVLMKYVLIIYLKDKTAAIAELMIHELKRFKLIMTKKTLRYLQLCQNIQNILAIFGILMLCLYLTRPLLTADYFPALETALTDSLGIDALILISQYYFLCIGSAIVLGYDLTYFVLCCLVMLHINLLKKSIKGVINSKNMLEKSELRKCVTSHQTVLVIYSKMKIIYSAMLLFHYFVTIVTVCTDLFALIRNPAIESTIVKAPTLVFFWGQFACYTFPAEQIASEFTALSLVLYTSNWYSNTVKFQKLILFMMKNSQRVGYLSGAGIIDINIDAFVSVIRRSFSFYAVMRNLSIK